MAEKKKDAPEIGYSQAVAEVEDILRKLDDEELDIDVLAAEVKRATGLIDLCREKLRKAEQEVNSVLENEKSQGTV